VIRVSGVRNDQSIRLPSADFGEVEVYPAELRPLQERQWANYILGVADELRKLNIPIWLILAPGCKKAQRGA